MRHTGTRATTGTVTGHEEAGDARKLGLPVLRLKLFAVLILPLGLTTALIDGRDPAAFVYAICLASVVALSILVARISKLTLRSYWRSFKQDGSR